MSQGPRSSADILAAHVVDLAPGDPVDLERLCSEHPAAATELRRLTAHWDQIQAVLKAMEAGQASPLAERLRRRYGDVDPGLSIDQAASVVRPPSTGGTLERLEAHEPSDSRYETRGEIARGGMGAILQVWDVDLRRTLAMKVALNKGSAEDGSPKSTDPRLLARFLEEAQITAQLDHPGIVPVHELGLDADGKVYFTMPLVRGRDLASILELVKTGEDGWTLARALNVLLKVCEAMAYAHTKEVIHRDLKPGNIMVGRFGEVYVMDWGLAKVLGREDSRDLRLTEDKPPSSAANLSLVSTDRDAMDGNPLMTMDGDVVGTPSYMSPEQARGELEAMGPASDVYSIGSILYHLLAGHMPYVPSGSKRNAFAVWGLLQEEAPEPLKKIAKGAPEELVAITTKAMERDLVKRYPHMMALGEDLRAYLEGRVVSAHATGPITELRKWVGRNKPFAATIATALIAVITIVAVTGVRQARLSETLGEKETELGTKELELAVLEERVSQGQHKLADLELALRVDQEGLHEARIMLAWAQNEFSTKELEAKDLLATARAESYVANVTSTALNQDAGNYAEATRRLDAAPEELRSWEWHHLALGENAAVDSIPGASLVAAWADDGNDVIFGSEEGFLYQQVAATHQAKNNAKVGVSTVTSLSRPNSSGRLACGTADGQITNWIGTATSGETWRTSDQQITALAVSEDGELIFAGQGDRHHDQITGVWQSSEASIHKIFVYRNDGALVHQIEHPGGKVLALLPLPGGRLISGGDDGRMRVWQLPEPPAEGEPLEDSGAPIMDLRVGPQAIHGLLLAGREMVVTLTGDGVATVWNIATGSRTSSLEGHGDAILSGDISPDGRLGATGCQDSTVAIWDTATSSQLVVLRGHRGPVRSVAFSPDGSKLLTASEADGLRIWDTGTRSAVSILRGEDHRMRQVNLQRTGKDALLWTLELEREEGASPLLLARLGKLNPAGDRIAFLGRMFRSRGRYPVGIWDLEGNPVHKLEGHSDVVRSLAWSHDGTRLASASDDGTVRLWDATTGTEVASYTVGEACLSLAFCPLGEELAIGHASGAVGLIDLATGAQRTLDGAHVGAVSSLAWTSDGAHLASGGADAEIRLWDRAAGGLEGGSAVLYGHQRLISCMVFSQDGTRLFSGSEDKTVRVWHRELRTSLLTLRGLLFPVQGLALTRDDQRLVTWEGTGMPLARVWDSSVEDAAGMWRERAHAQQAAQVLLNLRAMFPAEEDLRMVFDREQMPEEVRAICEVLLERSSE